MTHVMYDSTTTSAYPDDAKVAMGYVGPESPINRFVTFPFIARKYRHLGRPTARLVSIAVHSELDAEGLDIEAGDATPEQFPGFHARQIAKGRRRPFFYASRDNVPAVLTQLHNRGVHRAEYRILSAHYDHGIGPHICSPASCGAPFTADGTQWTDRAHGLNLDESLLADDWFGPESPAPQHPKRVHPKVKAGALAGALVTAITGVIHAAGVKAHLTSAETAAIATAASSLAAYFKRA